jgi:hypothetical protein
MPMAMAFPTITATAAAAAGTELRRTAKMMAKELEFDLICNLKNKDFWMKYICAFIIINLHVFQK